MTQIQSSILYISSFIISIFTYRIYNNKFIHNRKLIFIVILPTVFLSTFRYYVGTDYGTYEYIYRVVGEMNLQEIITYPLEIGYSLLNKITYILFNSTIDNLFNVNISIFGIVSFFTLIIIVYNIQKYKNNINFTLALFIYYLAYYNLSYNIMRQLLALSIILLSYTYLIENNIKKYLIAIFVGFLFHKTALIGLLAYFLKTFNDSKLNKLRDSIYYSFIFLSPILMNISMRILIVIFSKFELFNKYSLNFNDVGVGFLIYQLPIIIPVLIYKKQIIKYNKNYNTLINILLLQIPLQTLAYIQVYAYRMAWYGSIVQVLIVPIMLNCIENKKDKKIVMFYYLIFYLFMFLVINKGGSPDTSIYRFIWMK